MDKAKVGVVGASGYSGEELIRLLGDHPNVEIACLTSRQLAGTPVREAYPHLARKGEVLGGLRFLPAEVSQVVDSGARFVFLALPHGVAAEYAAPLLNAGLKVIDLSADFRVKDKAVYEEYYGGEHPAPELLSQSVYGLPELYREDVREASLVACPGCYPTSILVPLCPLLGAGAIEADGIIANSLSGVSGAGRKVEVRYLFVECNENACAYGLPKHRHLSEIEQELSAAAGAAVEIDFCPHLIPLSRGLLSTIYTQPKEGVSVADVEKIYEEAYAAEPFVRLLGDKVFPQLKHVTRLNFVDIGWCESPRTGRLTLLSAEDNLTKGAAGQAVQCLNIMNHWPETVGLLG